MAPIQVRYEDFDTERQARLISRIAHHLRFADHLQPDQVIAQLALSPETPATGKRYDPETLLHPGHITCGRQPSGKDQLKRESVTAIEAKHRDWLRSHGYELTA